MTNTPIVLGGGYWVGDSTLTLPPNTDRDFHPQRPVAVLSGPDTNSDPAWPLVLAAPISSSTSRRTRFCVKLGAGEANMSAKCWVRIPMVQPLLKADLRDMIGTLKGDRLLEVQARLFQYLGMADEEERASTL